ncbi:hypothetical protein FRUB_03843 [Fimbriiglobus ruber]|uniref:Uncharacterized protein n=1 Tax=Fimbriiglobus ruber TaxID=1908690 RepID=A0A225DZI1_9BACT|nr:hypothetical protein FRUB_03843 [Fimbriiglobus ruber]
MLWETQGQMAASTDTIPVIRFVVTSDKKCRSLPIFCS